MPLPAQYKEVGSWIMTKPSLNKARKNDPWWTVFGDETLNQLEQQVTCGNDNLKVAFSRYQKAKALALATQSQVYPTLLGQGGFSRQETSNDLPNSMNPSSPFNIFTLGAVLSYEVDAWGRIYNQVSTMDHMARASEFDLATVDLSTHSALASIYFELRGDNAAQLKLDRIVRAYEHAFYLVHQLHREGAVSALDEDQAMTRVENAKTAAIDLRLKRAQLEHALAVLVGEIPANFHLPAVKKSIKFATISPELPSTLLQNRPDVAAAAERVQAANATIGVARAAFFPDLNLHGIFGYQSQKLSSLLSAPSLIWSLGPPTNLTFVNSQITQVLFDGYYLQANLSLAKSSYFETVSGYRQTVLTAFQEVEDSLVATHRLTEESQTQEASTRAAKRALYQARQRMIEGMDTYLNVVTIEDEALQSEIDLINIHTRRQLAGVHLIVALGGGWHVDTQFKDKTIRIALPIKAQEEIV